ncbi:thioesterase family protein [Curvibacter sp. PAE-UM]|uniref:acyl-CoA thioesterase n=1 Tax=Curvibacter sp. PAE-UM TaxID=1714344 RepID=UPI00070F2628|nr:acyl-CoA thioesterase [Curvibacter sp. PAE-UM]KRH98660.1 4-hydroxybenzoyl-CoA thioesterase [Curvibacter sp. PAE-UM]
MTDISSPQPRTVVYTQRVEFGDCDPARIVWFPNFFRWIDAASRHFFIQCGVPPWHETEKATGMIGTPLVDTHARFVKTASYGDTLQIHTHVAEWREKSFVQRYQIKRENQDGSVDLIMECDEVRIFAAHRQDGKGIRAVPIPADIKSLCS